MTFDFHKQRAMSESPEAQDLIRRHLARLFPDALTIRKAALENDKLGADYWLEFRNGQFRAVDVKVRAEDWKPKGKPDVALEIWANTGKGKRGWAIDDTKITDYVLFVWLDTGRADLFDFRLLKAVTQANLDKWSGDCQSANQTTATKRGNYTARCLFVSGRDLHAAIYRWQSDMAA
jgi:hypothetical protein